MTPPAANQKTMIDDGTPLRLRLRTAVIEKVQAESSAIAIPSCIVDSYSFSSSEARAYIVIITTIAKLIIIPMSSKANICSCKNIKAMIEVQKGEVLEQTVVRVRGAS